MWRTALFALFASCSFLPEAVEPMPTRFHPAPSGDAHGLLVMLPGRGDRIGCYQRHGLVELAQRANPDFDVIEVDAHTGYYYARSITTRLHDDVIAPVRDRYRQIWLCGISMGGFGSAILTTDHPDLVDGLILLAPWTGDKDVAAEVRAAGGLPSWTPPVDDGSPPDIDATLATRSEQMWTLFRRCATRPATAPNLFVGYGDRDRFRADISLLAEALPAEHVHVLPGRHEWTVWQPLFASLSQRALADL